MAVVSTRPELACEIVPEGVIAARRQAGSGLLAAAAFAAFGPDAPAGSFAPYLDSAAPRVGMPGIQTGDPQQRNAVVQAMRRALESVGGRNGVLTLVVPDTAVRVLMLDFDSLPAKASDAIPLLRFRLKKLVPFDVDDASVSYQPLHATTGARALVAVLPNVVLREYEAMVREAGFEPGIVLPSTLACLGMVSGDEGATLLVHSNTQCVTTAIINGNELLLHRTQELPWSQAQLVQTMNPASAETSTYTEEVRLATIETASVTNADLSREIEAVRYPDAQVDHVLKVAEDTGEVLPASETLYPMIENGDPADSDGEGQQVTWGNPFTDAAAAPIEAPVAPIAAETVPEPLPEQPAMLQVDQAASAPGSVQSELHDAVIIAAAYYEDAVGRTPSPVLVAGAMDARTWQAVLGEENVTVRDLVALEDLGTAIDAGLSRAQLGAVCGALRG